MMQESSGADAASTAAGERQAILRWRRDERARLIAARLAMASAERAAAAARIAARLDGLLPELAGRTVSLYWPMRGEPDLRSWLAAAVGRGACCALPLVVEKNAPLVFRSWRPGEPLARGVWNIPVPAEGSVVTPDVVLAPLVGFDAAGYRLGYGGGYFDRTLAALPARPLVIGIGYAGAAIATIRPLAHDIPMDVIVTEEAEHRRG
ncbi:5-formyltetrahydrofolate cyclo-ligase [Labrys wisconsinensis]